MEKLKDYKQKTDLNKTQKLLNFAANHDMDIQTAEGVLNDFHIIYSDKRIKMNQVKPRKYIICFYEFASAWSNKLYILHTDNYEKVKEMANTYGLEEDPYEI